MVGLQIQTIGFHKLAVRLEFADALTNADNLKNYPARKSVFFAGRGGKTS